MKITVKDVFYEASLEELEKITSCANTPEKLDKEALNRIKAKTKEKCKVVKKKRFPSRRWFAAAVYVCLLAATAVGIRYIDFGNTPPVVSDTSDKEAAVSENVSSDRSENESQNVSNNVSSDRSENESQNVSNKEGINITGINWEYHYAPNACMTYFNGVEDILDDTTSPNSEPAWATVILESLTPLGTIHREEAPDYYFSVAEIKILDVHYYGKDLKDAAKSGDTIKIIVPYIINEGEVAMTFGSYYSLEKKETYLFPMTEIEKKYVVSFYERADSEKLKLMLDTYPFLYEAVRSEELREKFLKDNYPELSDVKLHLLSSYPLFSMDISETKNLSEFNFKYAWAQMYVATYDRYMKGNVSEDSAEAEFYNCFKDTVYRIFGRTPEKPTE